MSLPTADDLFRRTDGSSEEASTTAPSNGGSGQPGKLAAAPDPEEARDSRERRSSGRVRHDEKMTVYVTADELLDIEHARLALRRDHGLAVDRGRLVREAIAMALAELDSAGEESALVQRLNAS